MKCRIRLALTDHHDRPFAGIGVIRLLNAIVEHGSIHHAAKTCGLSYVKAWTMMNRLDQGLGQPVLRRQTGGVNGGGAVLTPFGKKFLRAFERHHHQLNQIAQRRIQHLERILKSKP